MFFCEDTCCLKNDKSIIGVIDRTHHDVDSHEPEPYRTYEEPIVRNSHVSDEDFLAFMSSGVPPRATVLVTWQSLSRVELLPESELLLVDRALIVGDVVKRSPQEAESGTVIGMHTSCTVAPLRLENRNIQLDQGVPEHQVGIEQLRKLIDFDASIEVPAKELRPPFAYETGDLIVYNEWLGRVEEALDEVTVILENNSVVVVEVADELEVLQMDVDRLSVGDYVETKKGNLRRGRWIYGAYDPRVSPHGHVIDVRTTEVTVHWLCRNLAPHDPLTFSSEPPYLLDVDVLESGAVRKYDHTRTPTQGTYQLGTDPCMTSHALGSTSPSFIGVGSRVRFRDLTGAAVKYGMTITPRTATLGFDSNVFMITHTLTTVIVQWQDLSITQESSNSLIPDPNVDDEDEVWPGEIVFTRASKPQAASSSGTIQPQKIGVVQSVRAVDRIALVKWFSRANVQFFEDGEDVVPGSSTGSADSPVEEVSLYDIRSNQSINRRRGDFVLVHPEALASIEPPPIGDLKWCGEVVDLGLDGRFTVRLGGLPEPRDIRVPPECMTVAYSGDMEDDNGPHELEDEYEEMFMEDDLESDDEPYEVIMPQGIVTFPSSRQAERWFASGGPLPADARMEVDDEDDEWSTDEDGEELEEGQVDPDTTMTNEPEGGIQTAQTTPESHTEADLLSQRPPTTTNNPLDPQAQAFEPSASPYTSPPQFAILDTPVPSTHHYSGTTSDTSSNSTRLRRINKELRILSTSLPPNIYVRTFSSRLDLLRILIIGPNDTPYEYAPFVLDMHLHPSYPNHPPEVFFHSWTNNQGPINPNLYEDGKVCLSLLGTWHADEHNESWSPSRSTVLQILVSLLGLVLVREPYYNEAGYEVRAGSIESRLPSQLYSERTYFRTRRFITKALSEGVEGFQDILDNMYLSRRPGAPRLLEKAIQAAEEVVRMSAEDGERDGLRKVSKGAVVQVERQIKALESVKNEQQGDER